MNILTTLGRRALTTLTATAIVAGGVVAPHATAEEVKMPICTGASAARATTNTTITVQNLKKLTKAQYLQTLMLLQHMQRLSKKAFFLTIKGKNPTF